MKLLIASVVIILFFGCKKTSQSANENPNFLSGNFSFNIGTTISGQNTCQLDKVYNEYFLVFSGAENGTFLNQVTPVDQFVISIKMPSNSVSLGTYDTKDGYSFMQYSHLYNINSWDYYEADTAAQYSGSKITFNVIEYDNSTKYVKCSFSGIVSDGSRFININNGQVDGIGVSVK